MATDSNLLSVYWVHWSSWADCLEMIAARNPGVADMIVTEMGQADAGFHVSGASEVREQLVRVGFNAPQWWDLRAGLRPPGQRVDERHVGIPGHGWQHEATEAVHAHSVQHDCLATSFSARTSFDPVTRRPDVRGPLHVLPCEPGVQDRLVFVQGVAAASPLASLASFLPQLPVWPST